MSTNEKFLNALIKLENTSKQCFLSFQHQNRPVIQCNYFTYFNAEELKHIVDAYISQGYYLDQFDMLD